jgi:hypothetical protein
MAGGLWVPCDRFQAGGTAGAGARRPSIYFLNITNVRDEPVAGRPARMLRRGNFSWRNRPGDRVTVSVPERIHQLFIYIP